MIKRSRIFSKSIYRDARYGAEYTTHIGSRFDHSQIGSLTVGGRRPLRRGLVGAGNGSCSGLGCLWHENPSCPVGDPPEHEKGGYNQASTSNGIIPVDGLPHVKRGKDREDNHGDDFLHDF